MTTLTQLVLNPRNPAVARDLDDMQAMHRRVMSLLPDNLGDAPRAQTDTLFRLEQNRGEIRLLVQSGAPVSPTSLPHRYSTHHASTSLDGLLARVTIVEIIRYSIITNPSKRAHDGESKGKNVAILGYDDIHAWWVRKATIAGVDVANHPINIDTVNGYNGSRQGQRVHHHAVRIEGFATVIDAEALVGALTTGIGRGKAHGLGLLTVISA